MTIPTQVLIKDCSVLWQCMMANGQPGHTVVRLAGDRLAELEKLSSDLITENAGLKNAFDALTSDEAVMAYMYKLMGDRTGTYFYSNETKENVRSAISAAREFVRKGEA